MYYGANISLEFLGDAGGSVQIPQSQSAVVGDRNLVHETVPESLGNARGSGQNCGSQGNETFCESFGDAGGSDRLDAGGSDENLYCEVDANKSPKLPLKESGDKKSMLRSQMMKTVVFQLGQQSYLRYMNLQEMMT